MRPPGLSSSFNSIIDIKGKEEAWPRKTAIFRLEQSRAIQSNLEKTPDIGIWLLIQCDNITFVVAYSLVYLHEATVDISCVITSYIEAMAVQQLAMLFAQCEVVPTTKRQLHVRNIIWIYNVQHIAAIFLQKVIIAAEVIPG